MKYPKPAPLKSLKKSCSKMMASLRSGRVFALSILAGLVAGGLSAAVSVVLAWPYVLALAELHMEELLADGEFDEEEFDAQMQSIYASIMVGSIATGIAAGALVGGARIFANSAGASPLKAALLIAGVAWFVLYAVPSLKYPPSPQALFDPQAGGVYYMLYAGYAAASGLSALGIAGGFRKIKRKNKELGMAALYLAAVATAFFAFPDYTDPSYFPQQLVGAWRAAISAAMTTLWFSAGTIAGLLWAYGKKA